MRSLTGLWRRPYQEEARRSSPTMSGFLIYLHRLHDPFSRDRLQITYRTLTLSHRNVFLPGFELHLYKLILHSSNSLAYRKSKNTKERCTRRSRRNMPKSPSRLKSLHHKPHAKPTLKMLQTKIQVTPSPSLTPRLLLRTHPPPFLLHPINPSMSSTSSSRVTHQTPQRFPLKVRRSR